jgi:hypothetical protein
VELILSNASAPHWGVNPMGVYPFALKSALRPCCRVTPAAVGIHTFALPLHDSAWRTCAHNDVQRLAFRLDAPIEVPSCRSASSPLRRTAR